MPAGILGVGTTVHADHHIDRITAITNQDERAQKTVAFLMRSGGKANAQPCAGGQVAAGVRS